MKWKGLVVAVAIVALSVAGCGGDSDGGGGGGGGSASASPTSGQVLYTLFNSALWMTTTAFSIVGPVPVPTSTKQTGLITNIECTGPASGFECTIWDSQGSATSADHKCDISGNYSLGSFHFDLQYRCLNYLADEEDGVTVNGDWTAQIYISPSFEFDESQAMSVGKAGLKQTATEDCEYASETNSACAGTFEVSGGTCTVECSNTALCQQATSLTSIDWAATSEVTITDSTCGVTTTIAANTTSLILFCTATETDGTMSFDLNGTIDSQAVDETINAECTNIF